MPNAQKFDFIEYQYSVSVVRDFPKIISIYKKLLPVLYEYAQYTGAWSVIQSVEDSLFLLEMQFSYYEKVYKNKGKMNEKK